MYKEMLGNSYLFGANAPFIEALYDRYLEDPASVEPRWRSYFDELQKLDDGARDVAHTPVQEYFAQLAKSPRAAVARVGSSRSWIQRFCGTSVMYMYSVPTVRQYVSRSICRMSFSFISRGPRSEPVPNTVSMSSAPNP